MEPIYSGHLGDLHGKVSCTERCPHFSGKQAYSIHVLGTSGVFLLQGCPLKGVPLYIAPTEVSQIG